ncbi:hypothetical protein QN277_012441 [Acacia crassicarpa]|uniref:Uncharacterized protein n=1 Tax=Acacia crassicarpa TaxID=499986 RepID=A0AAE1N125_9FABA|nr:hypothetical protein QN277_012441 [Acacia crassicarpa]
MLLRSSITSTKKFFHRTLENLKHFFSPGYHRLPKTPPHDHFTFPLTATSDFVNANNNNPTYEDLEKFYVNFTEQWDSQKEKQRRGSKKKTVISAPAKQVYDGNFVCASPVQKMINHMEKREEIDRRNSKRIITHHHTGKKQGTTIVSTVQVMSEKRKDCIVEKKLRELEMLDKGNVDHVMDIEEVLHYYSKLTCPAYLEILEKFFMEMYSEFFGQASSPAATPGAVKSRLKHIS